MSALVDIRQRLLRFGGRGQVYGVGGLLREFVSCLVWELQARAAGRLQGFVDCYRMRAWAWGLMPCLAISAIANGADPDEREPVLPEVPATTKRAR